MRVSRYFNQVQVGSIAAFTEDINLVVSAPTGSGKTVVFELAICRLIQRRLNVPQEFNIVYLAPIKALCAEKAMEWKKKFEPFGITVEEVTGDNTGDFHTLTNVDLICTTPEKWYARYLECESAETCADSPRFLSSSSPGILSRGQGALNSIEKCHKMKSSFSFSLE
uniref:Helicase ATP-binding domain-containing protein n=1 Tax=Rhodosorus marinus TaxID=101924 RepID=A0A7S2ZUV6_9RHOD|mmetsp:Transcript_33523/g.132220  ORF Transcript_33523/g.132220 Transcript_33523/m.132220 type:complete len:167 (+) Transcript_33523:313-813(+)